MGDRRDRREPAEAPPAGSGIRQRRRETREDGTQAAGEWLEDFARE
ncbi:MAG: hypothetical protein J0L92_00700 [Deltaproteobacteria bacterium]|nr:hypothetical protein [Deltaproteobacteria bacterium]